MEIIVPESIFLKINEEMPDKEKCILHVLALLKLEKVPLLNIKDLGEKNCFQVDYDCETFIYLYNYGDYTLVYSITNKTNPEIQKAVTLEELEKMLSTNI